MKFIKKNRAFTLIEIVVVIGIMAFLTTVIYSSFDASRAQSRDQKRISDISAIQLALEQFFQKNGVYPSKLADLKSTYISEIPSDSINLDYEIQYFPMTKTSDGLNCISYQLWTKFERNNQYLDSKKRFNSFDLPTKQDGTPMYYECGNTHSSSRIDTSNNLIYDVMP